MRLFVAVELPASTRQAIGALQDRLRAAPLHVRWAASSTIHLTLKFLGETERSSMEQVTRALEEAVLDARPLRLRPGGLGVFPEQGRPRVIWLGLEGDLAATGRLQEGIDSALAERGFPREMRPFVPHLTLGRCTGPAGRDWRAALDAAPADRFEPFEAGEIVLFESRTLPEGAVHTALARFSLGRGARGSA